MTRLAWSAFSLGAAIVTLWAWGRAAVPEGGAAPGGEAATEPCPWIVRPARAATAKEIAFQDPNPLLRKPDNPNYAPGPNGVAAVVETDREHFRHLFLEDPLTGDTEEIALGSEPRWSPDGRWIACAVWRSRNRPSVFSLADPASGTIAERDIGVSADEYAWSPNGHLVAVAGVPWGSDQSSDLWLVEVGGDSCRLTDTGEIAESDLRWLDDRRILYSAKTDGFGHSAKSQRWRVLTLERRAKAN